MKRKSTIWTLLAAVPLITAAFAPAASAGHDDKFDRDVRQKVIEVPTDEYYDAPKVRVWTRQGEGSILFPGESLDVTFRTNRSAYVVVLNVDTNGRVSKLFPRNRFDDGFVKGKRKVRLPGKRAGYRLMVTGPPGVERIVAFASDEPIAHRWRTLLDEDCDVYSSHYPRRSGATRWSASASIPVGDGGVTVSAGSDRLRQKVVPVPLDLAPVSMDETWFRVGRRGRGYDRRW